MNNELSVVRDLKRRVLIASALEEAERFEEADEIWGEMERIASGVDSMTKKAGKEKVVKEVAKRAPGLWKNLTKWLSKLGPAKRFEEGLARGTSHLKSLPLETRQVAEEARKGGTWAEKLWGGKHNLGVGKGTISYPGMVETHAPAALGAAGLGAAGLYGAGRIGGGRKGYERGLEEGMKEGGGYTPRPSPGTYHTGPSGSTSGGGYFSGEGTGPIIGPVPGSQPPSAMVANLESRISALENRVNGMEASLMKSS